MDDQLIQQVTKKLTDQEIEDLRIAYQSLPQMIAFEGQKPWNALSVFIQLAFVLAAGAIVPGFLPESSSEFVLAIVGIILSFTGIIAAIVWISLDARNRKINKYWVLSLREIEENLSKSINAFQRGKKFARGENVEVSGEYIKYSGVEKLSERAGFRIIYLLFGSAFFLLFLLNIYRLFFAMYKLIIPLMTFY